MRTTILGKSGLEVSAVGFGGIPIMRLDEAAAVEFTAVTTFLIMSSWTRPSWAALTRSTSMPIWG